MQLPSHATNQSYCTVSALEAGHIFLNPALVIDNAPSEEPRRTPSLSFLLQHSTNGKKFLFDLGLRKDWKNLPGAIVTVIEAFAKVEIPQDVVESLAKGGLSPADIDTVCLSHCHFDHCGDPRLFADRDFIVGGDTPKLFEGGGWPQKSDSHFAEDLLPSGTRFLGEDIDWQPIGPFPRAYDFYGDGSLYVIDAPGHIHGHVNLLARTSADGGWIYLAGDTAHHWNLITGKSGVACHPLTGCIHQDKELAEQMIKRVRDLTQMERVRVLLAHDIPWYEENKEGPAFFPGKIEGL